MPDLERLAKDFHTRLRDARREALKEESSSGVSTEREQEIAEELERLDLLDKANNQPTYSELYFKSLQEAMLQQDLDIVVSYYKCVTTEFSGSKIDEFSEEFLVQGREILQERLVAGIFNTFLGADLDSLVSKLAKEFGLPAPEDFSGPLPPPDPKCDEEPDPDDPPYRNGDGVLGPDGERYKLEGDTLTIKTATGEILTFKHFDNGLFGWKFDENEEESGGHDDASCRRDPLVIDLDGDGLEFLDINRSKVYYDFDGNGFAERTAWVGADDGLLVRDLNGDGQISGAVEIFAAEPDVGFDALRTFDANGDGVLDASDASFAELLIWQDANSDGVTDAGELKSLAEVGIQSINLASAAPDGSVVVPASVSMRAVSTATFADGQTTSIASVDFQLSFRLTTYLSDVEVDPTVTDLPFLNGYENAGAIIHH